MYTISCAGRGPGIAAKDRVCTYSISTEGLNEEGRAVAQQRVSAQMELVLDIQAELEEVEAVFYSQDVPWQFVGHEYVSHGVGIVEIGQIADTLRKAL